MTLAVSMRALSDATNAATRARLAVHLSAFALMMEFRGFLRTRPRLGVDRPRPASQGDSILDNPARKAL
jgi:hypothetical protein